MPAGNLSLTLPLIPTLGIYSGSAFTITAPKNWVGDFSSIGGPSVSTTNLELPMFTLRAQFGGSITDVMPAAVLSASGTVTGIGSFTDVVPAALLSASGTVPQTAQASLTAPMFTLVGYAGSLISVTSPAATLTASGTTGIVGGLTATLPMFVLTASGVAQPRGSASLLMPMPVVTPRGLAWITTPAATLVSFGSATVAVTYEAYAMNMKHQPRGDGQPREMPDQVTRYTNYPFDFIVRYKNSYYGANSSGLYLLEGTTDDNVAISWSFTTHMSEFGSENLKTIESMYIGGRLPPATTVTLYQGEDLNVPYAYTTPRGGNVQNYRQPFGRGVRSRYYSVGMSGTGGFTVDSLTFNKQVLSRRI